MFILSKIQKIICNILENNNNEILEGINNIYTYIPKNAVKPYIFIENKKFLDRSNFVDKIFFIELNLNIFDENTSNLNILNISEQIVICLKNLINSVVEDLKILNISICNIENFFDNSLIPTYINKINLEILVKEIQS